MDYELQLFADLEQAIIDTNKIYDIERIRSAFNCAYNCHTGQLRKSGEPYIEHPVAVSTILIDLGMDTDSIVAALLHDVVEDTEKTLEEVQKEFGEDVAWLVDGVTKLKHLPISSSREQQQAENVHKMLLAMAKDVRVIIIKLADRLHNMRTLEFVPENKRLIKSLETMEVYAPLAHRLGISGIKEELEDLSLFYLDRIAYDEIEEQLTLRNNDRDAFLQRIIDKINTRLTAEKIDAKLYGRIKSIYGIYRKVYMQGKDLDEIYDVYAVRITVDTVLECYNVLGVIHDLLNPLPSRFKDYISVPKQNMYQSLHTTVLDKEGIPFEVQIRTWDMHHTAEYGIAAHWKYKEGVTGTTSLDERLAWIRQLLDSQKTSDDVEDIVASIKTDMARDEVCVYTPGGDVIILPAGATAIDFAYAIHSAVGNNMTGAKVDGRIVSIDYNVQTGDVIEIITQKDKGPSRDWLNIVKTAEARNKIRSWFKKERRDDNILQGKEMLDREFRRLLIAIPPDEKDSFLLDIRFRQRFNSVEDFYAAIGYGGLAVSRIMPKIKEEFNRLYRTAPQSENQLVEQLSQKVKKEKTSSGVIVEGLDGCLVKFSKCCTPVPGDDITGFVTRGFGVSIHKKDCTNVVHSNHEASRWVGCVWAGNVKETFKATLELICNERTGILAEASIALSNMRIPLHTLLAREMKNNQSSIQVTISIHDLGQLQTIINTLSKIPDVISVQRWGQDI